MTNLHSWKEDCANILKKCAVSSSVSTIFSAFIWVVLVLRTSEIVLRTSEKVLRTSENIHFFMSVPLSDYPKWIVDYILNCFLAVYSATLKVYQVPKVKLLTISIIKSIDLTYHPGN